MAFQELAKRMVYRDAEKSGRRTVNIIGATPLDFSVNSSIASIKTMLNNNGFDVISTWAIGSTLDEIRNSGQADVNLVISYCGLAAAKELYKIFKTPYVIGVPFGKAFSEQLINDLKSAADTGENRVSFINRSVSDIPDITVIGESVISGSLAAAISMEYIRSVQVLCPLETEPQLLAEGDFTAVDEDDLIPHLQSSKVLIADPLYRPICPAGCEFISLPHEAFSGRIYRKDITDLIKDFNINLKRR
jgi:hypothetical protein